VDQFCRFYWMSPEYFQRWLTIYLQSNVQGTIVDRIDYNITRVSTSVEQGVKELVKAEETQKKGGMVMCVLVLIALCAVMLFVYVLKKILGF
jgi:t-SNARE complex subunit (syntaxin)